MHAPTAADISRAAILATVCFYLVRATPLALPMKRNRRIGFYYVIATAALIVMAVSLKPWGLLLLWPATATGLVASGYFFLGPGVFGKINGRLPLSTRLILAPVLLGQSLSLLYYSRQCRRWDRVTDRV